MTIPSLKVSSCSCKQALEFSSRLFYQSALDSVSYSAAFLAAAVAANFFISILTAPLAITAISIYFANISLNLLQEMQYLQAKALKIKLIELSNFLESKASYFRPIILISALALSFFSLGAGFALIAAYSLFTAIHISIQKNRENNNVPVTHGPRNISPSII